MYKSLPPAGGTDDSIVEQEGTTDESVEWKSVFLRAHTIEHHWRCGEVKPPKVCSRLLLPCNITTSRIYISISNAVLKVEAGVISVI